MTVTVAVCTFRRRSVTETLRSLACQTTPEGDPPQVIVVDNDDEPTARVAVEEAGKNLRLALNYLHVPGRNISVARNACLEACRTRWLAFIDDDETAASGWLGELVAHARLISKVAAVFGPVRAVYRPESAHWLRAGDFHSFTVVVKRGEIRTGYSANVILDLRHPAVAGRRFEPALGRSGGEDTTFFDGVYRAGGRLGIASDAVVEEAVVLEREAFGWLVRRRFRFGQTHGRVLGSGRGLDSVPLALAALIKGAWCMIAALGRCTDAAGWRFWILRAVFHLGVVTRLAGIKEVQIYGGGGDAEAVHQPARNTIATV